MESYKVVMGVGIAIVIVGFLLMSSMTIYYSWTKTFGELAVKVAVLVAGWWIYKTGVTMRDGR